MSSEQLLTKATNIDLNSSCEEGEILDDELVKPTQVVDLKLSMPKELKPEMK
jgi:hypothetical protein